MARILFEGWRFSPTSYAVVIQNHILDILKRPNADGHELFFRDIPFHTDWRQIRGLLPAEDEARIAALGEPPPDAPIDISFRMAHPTVVTKTNSARSWCWIVTEFGILEQSRIGDGRPVAETLRTPGVRIMTCSNWSKQGLVRSGADPDNVIVVPCGYDPALMRPANEDERITLRKALGWEGRFIFLNVSTLTWNKGIGMLLKAFAMVIERHPHAILVIKGNEEMLSSSAALRRAMSEMPAHRARAIAANIRYLGSHLTSQQVADLYRAADCYVAPYHAEGFNLPVLEAAACGLPVICTDGGPTDDFTTPEFCRRVVSVESQPPVLQEAHGAGTRILIPDGNLLIELMMDLVTNDAFRTHVKRAAPHYLSTRFTWRHTTDLFLRALLEGGPLERSHS